MSRSAVSKSRVYHGDVGRAGGVIRQQAQLPRRVAAEQALHRAQVRTLHADQQVIYGIIRARELHGALSRTGDPLRLEPLAHRRIDRISDLLVRDRGRTDEKFVLHAALFDQIAQQKLRHRAAADVAKTDKKYFYHLSFPFC